MVDGKYGMKGAEGLLRLDTDHVYHFENGTQIDGTSFVVTMVHEYEGEWVYEIYHNDGLYYMSQVVVDDYVSKGQLRDEIRECSI